MATKTYYGKLDCRSSTANVERTTNEVYYGLMDFLTYLSSSNVCTLVSWNSGSSAGTGAFSTRTYWDGANPFGFGSHSIWRFNTSSTRNWEWYMYVQVCSGTNGSITETFNLPITSSATAASVNFFLNSNSNRGILLQTAVCVSGTTSFNPWNGTLSQGNSTAASPRWVSGSNDRYLYVLPRSNDTGGTHATQKANSHSFGRGFTTATTAVRYHYLYDGDALMFLQDRDEAGAYDLTYVGAFELRNELTASGLGGGKYGFCMVSPTDQLPVGTIPTDSVIGTTAGTVASGIPGGGIAMPSGTGVSGSKGMVVGSVGTFSSRTYQPNTVTGKYDEFPIFIGYSESPFLSLLGSLNSGLAKFVVGPEVHQVTSDYTNAVFGGSLTLTNAKVIVPWSGSLAPGLGLSRTGSLCTWSYDYG